MPLLQLSGKATKLFFTSIIISVRWGL